MPCWWNALTIRQDRNDRRKIAMEDMASVRGVAPSDKYRGSIEQAGRALRGVSSDPEADMAELFVRAAFSWLIADGDFHLKNMAVLRVVSPAALRKSFVSARIAPAYDVVTTRVFPGLENASKLHFLCQANGTGCRPAIWSGPP